MLGSIRSETCGQLLLGVVGWRLERCACWVLEREGREDECADDKDIGSGDQGSLCWSTYAGRSVALMRLGIADAPSS